MSNVIVKDNESLTALYADSKETGAGRYPAEIRKREHYEKPSVRRKKKSEAARENAT